MKSSITSNWRPLLRALYAFIFAIAALWAMPRNARAQLYVTQGGVGGIVSKYNATTGALINFHFITGLNKPTGLAVQRPTASFLHPILFVASEGVFPSTGTVSQYDATTGALINANFITGLNAPFLGLVKFRKHLFVVNSSSASNKVSEYSSITGAPINANFITGLNFPEGLAVQRLAFSVEAFLFVANFGNNTVGKYDVATGAQISVPFIENLNEPSGLEVSGNILFVANFGSGTVSQYDATTGALINANLITGLNFPAGLAVKPPNPSFPFRDPILFVVSEDHSNGTVGKYDAITGLPLNANFITGLITPIGIAVR